MEDDGTPDPTIKLPMLGAKVLYKCPFVEDFFIDAEELWLYSDRFCHQMECNYIFLCDVYDGLEGKDTFKTKDFKIKMKGTVGYEQVFKWDYDVIKVDLEKRMTEEE